MTVLAWDLAIPTGSPRGCFDQWVESRASRGMSVADLLRVLAFCVQHILDLDRVEGPCVQMVACYEMEGLDR